MNRQLEVLFVSPDSSFQAYQALSKDFSAIEPPTWALLLAQSCRTNGWALPDSFAGYGLLSYDSQPTPWRHCSVAKVLRFRDEAWQKYFSNPVYLDLVERQFGLKQPRNVELMDRIRLRRRLLADPPPENSPRALAA